MKIFASSLWILLTRADLHFFRTARGEILYSRNFSPASKILPALIGDDERMEKSDNPERKSSVDSLLDPQIQANPRQGCRRPANTPLNFSTNNLGYYITRAVITISMLPTLYYINSFYYVPYSRFSSRWYHIRKLYAKVVLDYGSHKVSPWLRGSKKK